MKKILLALLLMPVICFSQKLAPYKYGEVDTVHQYADAQVISYNDKSGKHKRDTVWNSQRKQINIDWAHVVMQEDRYLKPRIIYSKEIKKPKTKTN